MCMFSREAILYIGLRVYLHTYENFKKEPMLDAHCANILINRDYDSVATTP